MGEACLAASYAGRPCHEGDHKPHPFRYGPGDIYTGHCGGRKTVDLVIGGDPGAWGPEDWADPRTTIGTVGVASGTGERLVWSGTAWVPVWMDTTDLLVEREGEAPMADPTPGYTCLDGPEPLIHVPPGPDGEPLEIVTWRGVIYERVRSTSGGDWVYIRT